MIRKSVLPALLVVLAGPAAAEEDAAASPIDLSGVIVLDYDPDDAAFAKFAPAMTGLHELQVALVVDSQGSITKCEANVSAALADFEVKACEAMRKTAKITIQPGYDMAGRPGRFTVTFWSFAEIEREAVLPIQFVEPGSDVGVSLVLGPESEFFRNGCFSSNVAGDPFMSSASFDRACELFLTMSPEERERVCKDQGTNFREHGFLCAVRTQPIAADTPPEVSASLRYRPRGDPPSWTPVTVEEEALRYQGVARVAMQPEYPGAAMRHDESGVSRVLVTFDKRGKVFRCRPVETSGSALLDNSTCEQIIRSGRVVMSDGAWPGDDMRTITQTVHWALE